MLCNITESCRGNRFCYHSITPCFNALLPVRFKSIGSQSNDYNFIIDLFNYFCCLGSIHICQIYIHQDKVNLIIFTFSIACNPSLATRILKFSFDKINY